MTALTRRELSLGLATLLATAAMLRPRGAGAAEYPVTFTDAEWRRRLTAAQYAVLCKDGMERAGSSPLDREKRAGTFTCAGCDAPLFASRAKYDSGTGWPSFTAALPGATGSTEDRSFGASRTAVNCARCGGHLGHVFDDGPPPIGQRWCMNGVAMRFRPGGA